MFHQTCEMRKYHIEFDITKLNELASDIFMVNPSMKGEDEKFQRMRQDALAVRDRYLYRLQPMCQYIHAENFSIDDDRLTIGKAEFTCSVFQQIDPSSVEGLFIYALTVGDYRTSSDDIMEVLYVDMWGNAYVDAARNMMKNVLEEGYNLSDNFGPGFYGMNPKQMKEIEGLLDFAEMGMKVNTSGIIDPVKSCGGIYFVVNDIYVNPDIKCRSCMGNRMNCKLCQAG